MRRIVVVGCPGNGKSTLAAGLADRLGLDHIELDSLFHVTDWESASPEEFRAALVERMDAASDGWVTCGNYTTMCEDLHIERADTLVWLDQARGLVTWRVAKRTVRRALTRERLYGNDLREPWSNFLRWDPNRNIIRWAWVHQPLNKTKINRHLARPAWAHLDVHHLTTPAEVDDFLAGVVASDG